jgi:hypothetical protein
MPWNSYSKFIALFLSLMLTSAFADESDNVTQGAQKYDWDTCVSTKTNACVNNTCENSPDINCSQNCASLAEDKCQAEGISKSQ